MVKRTLAIALRLLVPAVVLTAVLTTPAVCLSREARRAEKTQEKENAAMPPEKLYAKVHESVIAGTWYPGSKTELQKTVEDFLAQVPATDVKGRLIALISPHAGYTYSGQVAAHAYKQLEKQKFKTVVVIAPSHYARFEGVSIHDRGGHMTPLGAAPLDEELASALKERNARIRFVPEAFMREHAMEIQLPFLQVAMPGLMVVPLVMGNQDLDECRRLADTVAACIEDRRDKRVLVVASSDLSHFHPDEEARALDRLVLERVGALDPEGLAGLLAEGKCEACGGGPIVTAMLIARKLGADKGRVLHYANSSDVTGDRSKVVGYMAAALFASGEEGKEGGEGEGASKERKVGIDLGLSPKDKAFLLKLAKRTIEARSRGEGIDDMESDSPVLGENRGAFVTLKKHGELRGCIGHIVGNRPLKETIAEMAVAAAFRDPRFPPVKADELNDLEIEISVLTPLERIRDMKEIQVGVHGIFMKRGGRSGLLLPQVAVEYGWDCGTFLEHTCAKAGLPADAWKDPNTEIYVFSADVFR